ELKIQKCEMATLSRICRRCLYLSQFHNISRITHNYRYVGSLGSSLGESKQMLWNEYNRAKAAVKARPAAPNVDPLSIFSNNELSLGDINVYGFDYDYTLASYRDELHFLIYQLGREALVNQLKYPKAILGLEYNPGFAVRGIHYDIRKGLLMKIDAFHNIQPGTVYRGLEPVEYSEVIELYGGTHVSVEYVSPFFGKNAMHQLMDLFALPEVTLLSNITQYFNEKNIAYDPEYVFYDVRNAVQGIHTSGLLHQKIMENLDVYIEKGPEVAELLQNLAAAGKKLFLLSNSGFPFVDKGMTYMIGPDWMDLFDVCIVNARKPKFFHQKSRPFRIYEKETGMRTWDRVSSLQKGKIYQEGNVSLFSGMTGWIGSQVLYCGDHVYSDLADPGLRHGWRTGAIIPELENEISIQNSISFKTSMAWMITLQNLIERLQIYDDSESQEVLHVWMKERDDLRNFSKEVFNPQFGSVFRTYHNPTYFFRRLHRLADLYMSSIVNLSNYSDQHTFYPRRWALPHEVHYGIPWEEQGGVLR
ncbi:unnamed protein product, partial [Owenia fusiformis]